MILLLDNYDSFTFNLLQYVRSCGEEVRVERNDRITVKEIEQLKPERIIISPGPCTPSESGISRDVIRAFDSRVPVLGVCLGHQCIAEVYGGRVVHATRLMHGKVSEIDHNEKDLFEGIPSPIEATRYHSLMVEEDSLPDCLEITARATDDHIIMGIRHTEHPVFGLQFHPESILTDTGMDIIRNFLEI